MKSVLKSYIRLKTKPLSEDTKNVQDLPKSEVKQPETNNKHDAVSDHFSGKKLSLGDYLQEARVNSGQTIHQVSQITKIHTHYLEALEREDYANTPPSIYVKAYIKRLCELYKIDQNRALAMFETYAGEPEPKLPENLVKNLEETKLPNLKQEEKIRQYIKYGAIGLGVIVVLILMISILFAFTGKSSIEDKPLSAEEKTQLSADMEKIFTAQTLEAVALRPDLKK